MCTCCCRRTVSPGARHGVLPGAAPAVQLPVHPPMPSGESSAPEVSEQREGEPPANRLGMPSGEPVDVGPVLPARDFDDLMTVYPSGQSRAGQTWPDVHGTAAKMCAGQRR